MSASQQTTLYCDVYGCESTVTVTGEIHDAEVYARTQGWRCVPVGDFCEKVHTLQATA